MHYNTKITRGGRLIIPAKLRQQLDLKDGENVVVQAQGRGLKVIPVRESIRRAQELVASRIKGRTSLVDELIAGRRKEAAEDLP